MALIDEQMQAKTPASNPAVTQATATGYDAATGTAATMDPTTRSVQNNETVQGQIAGIIDANSPLMQRAVARAQEQMASRGLLNSSIAIGAGQNALYDAALPIAQQDANTYTTASRDNQSVLNNSAQFNTTQKNAMTSQNLTAENQAKAYTASAENAASAQNAQASNTSALAGYDAAVKTAMQNADSATRVQLQTMAGDTQTKLANIEAQFKNEMQANASAADLYKQVVDNVTRITLDPDMPPDAKQRAANEQMDALSSGLQLFNAATTIDISPILDAISNIDTTYGGNNTPTKPSPVNSDGTPYTQPSNWAGN